MSFSPVSNIVETNTPSAFCCSKTGEARNLMRETVLAYVSAHTTRQRQVKIISAFNSDQVSLMKDGKDHLPLKQMPPMLPPLAVASTTGLGKSALMAEVQTLLDIYSASSVFCVHTHKLAKEYAEDIIPGARHHFGRTAPREDLKNPGKLLSDEFTCWKSEFANEAGEKGHIPSASLCITCPHGRSGTIANSSDPLKLKTAEKWLRDHELNASDFNPCRYLYEGLPTSMESACLVMTQQGFSQAMGLFLATDGQENRLVVFDEKVDMAREVTVSPGWIAQWSEALDKLRATIKSNNNFRAKLPNQNTDSLNVLRKSVELEQYFDVIQKALDDLSVHLIREEDISVELARRVIAIQQRVAELDGMTGGTAVWEKITFTENREFFIPLRALKTLALNFQLDTAQRVKKHLIIYQLTQPIEWAIEHGSCIFLDATLSHTHRLIIEKLGGVVFEAIVTQNIQFTLVERHLYNRGSGEDNDGKVRPGYVREARTRMNECSRIAQFMQEDAAKQKSEPKGFALLAHKAWLKYSDPSKTPDDVANSFSTSHGVKIGWHGAHDRGHNQWQGFNLAIVGQQLLDDKSIQRQYAGERVALIAVGLDAPKWDGNMSRLEKHEPYLPVDPLVRAWLISLYVANLVQAIGRIRGVNSEALTLLIYLFGGCQTPDMLKALESYGISVDRKMQDFAHQTAAQYRDRGTNIDLLEDALLILQASNIAASVRTLREAVKELGGTADTNVLAKFISAERESGRLPCASRGGRPRKANPINCSVTL